MGLLDTPKDAAMMQMAMGLLSAGGPSRTPISLGQAFGDSGQQAMQVYRQRENDLQNNQLRDMQIQQGQIQQAELMRKRDALKAFRDQLPPQLQNRFDVDPQGFMDQLKPKAPVSVAPGASLVDPNNGYKPVYTAPQKPEAPAQGYLVPDGQGGWKIDPVLYKAAQDMKRAGAGSTNVFNNTKDNFKNERELRNDFQGLPTTKAFREVQSAHDQIKTALSIASPASDLAAATKIMKILDPGSVVRESELGMAMAASGLMDRINNYAQMTMSGQKLTPEQRKDFGKLADELYAAAEGRYNQSVEEYQGTAKDYGLNASRVAKPAKKSSVSPGGWSATVVK